MLTKGIADVSRTTRRSDNEWREKSCCRAALMGGGQCKAGIFTGFGVLWWGGWAGEVESSQESLVCEGVGGGRGVWRLLGLGARRMFFFFLGGGWRLKIPAYRPVAEGAEMGKSIVEFCSPAASSSCLHNVYDVWMHTLSEVSVRVMPQDQWLVRILADCSMQHACYYVVDFYYIATASAFAKVLGSQLR